MTSSKATLLSTLILFLFLSLPQARPTLPAPKSLSEERSELSRRLDGELLGKIGVTVGVSSLLIGTFLYSARMANKATAPPDEGAFTPEQEKVVLDWFHKTPNETWQGDEVMDEIYALPNASQREKDMFLAAWEQRRLEITVTAPMASSNTTEAAPAAWTPPFP